MFSQNELLFGQDSYQLGDEGQGDIPVRTRLLSSDGEDQYHFSQDEYTFGEDKKCM